MPTCFLVTLAPNFPTSQNIKTHVEFDRFSRFVDSNSKFEVVFCGFHVVTTFYSYYVATPFLSYFKTIVLHLYSHNARTFLTQKGPTCSVDWANYFLKLCTVKIAQLYLMTVQQEVHLGVQSHFTCSDEYCSHPAECAKQELERG